ncbi:hypothetical protein [Subdoligranulum variabile]|uniref:hypothetical protein n=1 Tax=Subdoligranulum variabile TaxID=214851 RepID=UPI0026EEEFE6|nr:hypothetical protein [Subdoligranulum variabile]
MKKDEKTSPFLHRSAAGRIAGGVHRPGSPSSPGAHCRPDCDSHPCSHGHADPDAHRHAGAHTRGPLRGGRKSGVFELLGRRGVPLLGERCAGRISGGPSLRLLHCRIQLSGTPRRTAGETILYDTDGAPCFPYEDFLGTAQAIFGPETDYTAYIPNEPGPEDTARAAWGYGTTYVQTNLDENSFVLDGDTITVQAQRRWVSPGYSEDLGMLTYTFAIQPDNEYCRYRLLWVVDDT